MSVIAIIQARMGSTRLPGKIMKKINGNPILWYCIERIKKAKKINKIIVATSINKENNVIEEFCKKESIICFRGDENDVLDRYYKCAKKYYGRVIIRLTSDCPLIDPIILDNMINFFHSHNYDYLRNTWFIDSYPSGFDIEIFNINTIESHWVTEKSTEHREHVLSSLDGQRFKKGLFNDLSKEYLSELNFDINKIHLSVDTSKDFRVVKKILNNFNKNIDFTFNDVMDFLNNNIHLLKINVSKSRENQIMKAKNRITSEYNQTLNPQQLNIMWDPHTDYLIGVEDPGISIYKNKIVVICGFNGGSNYNKYPNTQKFSPDKHQRGFKDLVAMYDTNLKDWVELPNFPGEPRQSIRTVSIPNIIYVWGGFCYKPHKNLIDIPEDQWPNKTGFKTFRDGYCLHFSKRKRFEWKVVPDLPYSSCGFLLLSRGTKIFIITGATIFNSNEDAMPLVQKVIEGQLVIPGNTLYMLDTKEMKKDWENGWRKICDFPGTPRLNAAGCIYKGYIYIVGGIHTNSDWTYGSEIDRFYYVKDNWKYNIRRNEWSRISNNPYHVCCFGGHNHLQIYDKYLVLISGHNGDITKIISPEDGLVNIKQYNLIVNKLIQDKQSIILYDMIENKFIQTSNKFPIEAINIPYLIKDNIISCVGGEMCTEQKYNDRYYAKHIELFVKGKIY